MLDVSDRIAAFIEKRSLWKEDITNMTGNSQCFSLI